MKLLFCCENYPPSVGGVQEVVRQIAERLAAKGHDVTVATGLHAQRSADVLRNGVRVVSFPISGNWVRGMVGPLDTYRQFVQKGKFDVICIKAAQQWTFDALIDVLPSIRARKVFIPCGFSGLYQRAYKSYFTGMPQWLRQCDALIFYANDYQDIRFAKALGLNAIHVLHNGADEREFTEITDASDFRGRLGIPSGHDLMLTVGTITGAKGHWEVARAFDLAQFSRPTTLLLNGNLPHRSLLGRAHASLRLLVQGRPSINTLVRRNNAQDGGRKQILLVDLPRSDVVQAFKASDLFVFASHVEYSPLVLFEAAAAGTAFLTVPVGNAEEIVRWTGAGLVCPVPTLTNGYLKPDAHLLSREMEALMGDSKRRVELGRRGRQAFLETGFSWAEIVTSYERILMGASFSK